MYLEVSFKFSPDSQHIVYQTQDPSNKISEVLHAPTNGGESIRLNPALGANDRIFFDFLVSPNSKFIVYHALLGNAGIQEIYLVPIQGGRSQRLNSNLPNNGQVDFFYTIDPHNQYVVYRADQDVFDQFELFAVELRPNELCLPIRSNNGAVVVICL